ncbi:hypothetical protein GCM10020256_52240 [Streptomyces thermocoprophilus]
MGLAVLAGSGRVGLAGRLGRGAWSGAVGRRPVGADKTARADGAPVGTLTVSARDPVRGCPGPGQTPTARV